MSSTEKHTLLGRAVARVRDRYRDHLLANGTITLSEYVAATAAMNDVKIQYRKLEAEERRGR